MTNKKETMTKEFKVVATIAIIFFITIVGILISSWMNTSNLEADIKAKQDMLDRAQVREESLEAPIKYLNNQVEYRLATKEEIVAMTLRLKNLHEEVIITEMKIRCGREALYKTELNCQEDYKDFISVK